MLNLILLFYVKRIYLKKKLYNNRGLVFAIVFFKFFNQQHINFDTILATNLYACYKFQLLNATFELKTTLLLNTLFYLLNRNIIIRITN